MDDETLKTWLPRIDDDIRKMRFTINDIRDEMEISNLLKMFEYITPRDVVHNEDSMKEYLGKAAKIKNSLYQKKPVVPE